MGKGNFVTATLQRCNA